jgi:glycosyltransferase involved in cell wall biosynthesis
MGMAAFRVRLRSTGMVETNRRRRFVLVDPSFDGKGGDKWQYALTFFDSAERNGYDFILLAHKTSPLIETELQIIVDQRNVFDAAFFQHGKIAGRHASGKKRRALKNADARLNKELAQHDAKIGQLQNNGDFVGAQRLREKRAALLQRHIDESARLLEEIERDEPVPQPFNRDDFAQALAEQLLDLQLQKGDVLFLHTATQGMMESLTEVSARLPDGEALDIDAYFLFHFGAEAPDARTYIDRYYSFSHFETLGLRLKTGSPFKRVHLLATSAKLRDELEGFCGLPVGRFDGLTNLDRYVESLGGPEAFETTRAEVLSRLGERRLSIGVRVADLDEARVDALRKAMRLLEQQGFRTKLRCAYHAGNKAKAVTLLGDGADAAFVLEDTTEHGDYIRFLAASTIMILPYRPEIYKKRVSAVLHDCAVLGVSCVVPRGSTLEDARDWADIYCYHEIDEIPGVLFRAVTALLARPGAPAARAEAAAQLFASDVISRLLGAMDAPSLVVEKRGPVATVVMPLWGRVGSSCIFEAQMQFLLRQGYFVIQVFVQGDPVDQDQAIGYFWRMLDESSRKMRGSLQRIAFRTDELDPETLPADANGFDAYLEKFALNALRDPVAEGLAEQSAVTLVNHVFNTRLARKIGGGRFILESHDIQSVHMAHWPLRNPFTDKPEQYEALFAKELEEIGDYDYVVNISVADHRQLSLANPKSKVVTPYIAPRTKPRFESVEAMAYAYGWDKCYYGKHKFDYLLVGDSHPANVDSALWFLNEVYIPHLQPLHHSLAIVGRLSKHLADRMGGVGNVYYCGFVDDIAEVRNLSRIAVLPDRRGSGISMKTLETLAFGSPFVGTSTAFRGLSELLPKPPPLHDEPAAFAKRLEELRNDENKQAALGAAASEMYQILAGKNVYEDAWRDVLGKVGLAPSPAQSAPLPAPGATLSNVAEA